MRIIEKIALAIIVPMLLLTFTTSIVMAQSVTSSVPSGIPFGGLLAVFVKPNLACPFAHSVVADFVTLQVIGVAVIPGSSQVYQNNNQEKAGSYILGTYIPAPLPCLLPYPVWPISQVGTS